MKYRILIKYTSVLDKDFYEIYKTTDDDGQSIIFETSDVTILKSKIKELDKEIGFRNIMVVTDVTYDIWVSLNEEIDESELTDEDIDNIYNESYKNIFGGEENA